MFFDKFYLFLFFNAVSALTSGGFRIVSDRLVLIQYTGVTDGRTDTTRRHVPRLCIALRGKN